MKLEKALVAIGEQCPRCYSTEVDGRSFELAFSQGHIHEKQDGGADKKENLQVLCNVCYEQKTLLFQQRRKELKRELTEEESSNLNGRFMSTPDVQIRTRKEAYDFLRKVESIYLNARKPALLTPISKRG